MKNKAFIIVLLGGILNNPFLYSSYLVDLENVFLFHNTLYFTIQMKDSLQISQLDYTEIEIDDSLKTLSEHDYRRIKDTLVISFDPEESYHASSPVTVKVDYDPFHFIHYRWVRNPFGKAEYCIPLNPNISNIIQYLKIRIDNNQTITSIIQK